MANFAFDRWLAKSFLFQMQRMAEFKAPWNLEKKENKIMKWIWF